MVADGGPASTLGAGIIITDTVSVSLGHVVLEDAVRVKSIGPT